jgi:hypothetical protein
MVSFSAAVSNIVRTSASASPVGVIMAAWFAM